MKTRWGGNIKGEKWDMPVALGICCDGYDLHHSGSSEALAFSTSTGIPQKLGAPCQNIYEAPSCRAGVGEPPGDCLVSYCAHCVTYYGTEENCCELFHKGSVAHLP